ncbi:magnesium chelatase [Thermosediminibacter litoriperuensis]|uniref:Magnesium chelatase subunit I n=1 Tax=Thermosediminibacter litoriperuensis TaxID=291989 RepID=A0A5S5AJ18_9FIRM|nr:magnesium chelatase [Thermosediminibacter litoriperuensis]TYP50377.1 magnesium chelatase subunit I [Thermosediminibacter litoriperuensis]
MKRYSQLIRHEGNSGLFDIIDMAILATLSGIPIHIHAEGLRGTGKTTIIRASRNIFPKIERIKGCDFNCDPKKPHCPLHRDLSPEEIEELGVEQIDMPFLEISHSAKKGTVVGSIDLEKLSSRENPQAALLLGTIPRAHRGVIFVDEINRLADTAPDIVDILLDVMGTKPGRIQIEEVGLPVVELPVQVSVWAASNPDEEPGPLEDIRRQLSDRFDFVVNVERPKDVGIVRRILEGYDQKEDIALEMKKVTGFLEAQKRLNESQVSDDLKTTLASLYVNFGLESIRGIESILLGARLRGALLGKSPDIKDVVYLARYALKHRTDGKNLTEILKNLENLNSRAPEPFQKTLNELSGKKTQSRDPQVKASDGKDKLNALQKIFSLFSRAIGGKTLTSVDPKNVDIKAPPHKAVPIKQLDVKECVKTEDELW